MIPPESGPDPLRARRLAVRLLEARRVLRLLRLCMCFSFERTFHLYFTPDEPRARRCALGGPRKERCENLLGIKSISRRSTLRLHTGSTRRSCHVTRPGHYAG